MWRESVPSGSPPEALGLPGILGARLSVGFIWRIEGGKCARLKRAILSPRPLASHRVGAMGSRSPYAPTVIRFYTWGEGRWSHPRPFRERIRRQSTRPKPDTLPSPEIVH